MSKTGRLSGAVLSDKAATRLVKTAFEALGLDPDKYSGHSLRAGLATAAGDQGAGLAEVTRRTRHKSTNVALGYLRPADLWRNNVTDRVFGGGKRRDCAAELTPQTGTIGKMGSGLVPGDVDRRVSPYSQHIWNSLYMKFGRSLRADLRKHALAGRSKVNAIPSH